MKGFIFISTVVLAALLLAANGYSTEKNNFKITSWNIMALTSKPFKSVIMGVNSTRIKIDYERISSYIGEIDADIISLQEISDINALDKILSPYGYKYMFSPRSENPSKRSENDIFTAIAVRDNDRIEFSPVQEIIGTSFETKSDRYTRSAIYTDIYFDKVYQFTFVAVHLKSGCSSTQKISKSSRGDCLTLHKQIKAIGKWAAEQKEKRIIYAGDFNRYIQKESTWDSSWSSLHELSPHEAVSLIPSFSKRYCFAQKDGIKEPIDFFIAFPKDKFELNNYSEFIFYESDIKNGVVLSDHCPISVHVNIR